MSSGATKRPLDLRSRGNSPTSKRTRPLQAKNTTASGPRNQTPPSSRKPSSAGLSTQVPDNTRLVSDCNKTADSAHAKDRPREKPGRSDQASRHGASVPSHCIGSKPSAPSMLPVDSKSHTNVSQCEDKSANDKPLSMQSLRMLQDRRRAIAAQASPTNGPAPATNQLEAKIKAQQMDIFQLRKERDDLERRLTKMEGLLENLSPQNQQHQDSSKDLQYLLTRSTTLENSPLALEAQKTARSTVAKILALENEITMLKRSQESQKNEIAALNTWKTSQPKTTADDLAKATNKIMEKTEEVIFRTQKEMLVVEARLGKRISKTEQSLEDNSTRANNVESLAAKMQKFPQQVDDICHRLTNVELGMDKTNSKIESVEVDLQTLGQHVRRIKQLEDDADTCLHFRQVTRQTGLPNLHKAQEDIDWRLRRLEQAARDQNKSTEKAYSETERIAFQRSAKRQPTAGSVDLSSLAFRVDEPERAEQGFESNRSSTPTISSASVNTLARSVEELAKDFKSFQYTQKESRDVGSKLTDVIERLGNIEANIQGLEALKDHVVFDKSLEASLTGLLQHLSAESHALQTDLESKIANIQLDRSNVPSETAPAVRNNDYCALATTTVELAARLNGIQTELDSLSDDFNEAGQKIYEHSATIAVMKDQVPELFRQQFDPFKYTVEEQLGTVNRRLEAHASILDGLRKEHVEIQTRNTKALETKADMRVVGQQIDSITFALKDLEHRYQNISTEEMHQRMVHWFVQMYPTSAALMKDTAQLQQDVNQLKVYCNETAWIRARAGVLRDLCKHGTQLQAIAQQYPTQNQTKMEQTLSDAQSGLLQARQVTEETKEQVSQIKEQMTEMRVAAFQHRRDFNAMKDTLIEPNRDFFGLFGTVLAVLAQLQQVAESLNQNLPDTPLKLDWECYFPSLMERSKTGTEDAVGNGEQ